MPLHQLLTSQPERLLIMGQRLMILAAVKQPGCPLGSAVSSDSCCCHLRSTRPTPSPRLLSYASHQQMIIIIIT
ncbi:unknown [Bacillus thuringiensis phage MZTP02]|uniref:Uncharacterized protein n=1 Tax=Bacillus thuringiensis phage MZTP02 TaxID=311221 RepID=Q56AR3_9CAUD|nr:unknown [Bacillus thuringiensis phage MZTP02]